jgi:hypothetical protein
MSEITWGDVEALVRDQRAYAAEDRNRLPESGGAMGFKLINIVDHSAVKGVFDKQASSQATFAVAWVVGPEDRAIVIASVKGGKKEQLEPVVREIQIASGARGYVVLTNNTTGLHAEMQIVQYCLQELGIGLWDLYLKGLQIACIGKPVCQDCAGFMNIHSIGHMSVTADEYGEVTYSLASGPPSVMMGGQWMDPTNGGVFIGGNDVYSYQMGGGRTISRPLW